MYILFWGKPLMLIPFDMIAAMLFLGYYAETTVANPPAIGYSLATALSGCAALFLAGFALDRGVLWRIRRRRPSHTDRRRLAGVADIGLRALLVAVYIVGLTASDLPWSVAKAMGWRMGGETFLFQLIGLALYVCYFFSAWLPMYGLHRETNWGQWTRFSFLVHKARYNLFMLLAWLPFALLADWFSGFMAALPVLFLLAAWTFPYLLARIWGCTRFPEGETLDMVRRLEARAGAKFSRVYLWEPGGGNMQNAAAVGIFRPFRYLFLTPALIKNMPEPELEAVILHELGHVRKKHLLFYLFTSLAGVNLAVLAGAFMPLAGTTERFIVTGALVLAYFRLVFGWLSRNMERQADLFSLEKTGAASGLVNALEKLAISAGHIRRAASWHHLGVAERVDFLRRADRNRDLLRWHNARVSRMMGFGYAVSLCVLAGMGWLLAADHEPFVRSYAPHPRREEAHWRRVMHIMPGSPSGPLELAYRLAPDPGKHDEVVNLVNRVLRLPCGPEEKAAAMKLAGELGGRKLADNPAQTKNAP